MHHPTLPRRRFLELGAAGAAAGALGTAGANGAPPAIRTYRRLGRTGLEISDISFGSSSLRDPDLVRHALDRGVNYFDCAESYTWGNAEEAIGEALQGVRDRVFVTSKTRAGANTTRERMMLSLEASLERLRTDYVDVYFNHALNDVQRIKNPEWPEFIERAKRQGKIRFSGVSGHGSHLAECLDHTLDHDLADVILVAFNFAQDPEFHDRLGGFFSFVALQPELPRIMEKAKAKDVGVVAMKVLMGARLNDMRPFETGGATFAQAAFRWVLNHPHVDALLISMKSKADIDEYVAASGSGKLTEADLTMLGRYAAFHGERYCQHGCGLCESSCPAGVEIPEVLRTRMYDVDYRDHGLARYDYGRLERNAGACLGCSGEPCRSACPNGLPIAALTRDTAHRLG